MTTGTNAPEPTVQDAATKTIAAGETRFDIEFPEELKPTPEPPATAEPTAAEPAKPEQARTVPKAALDDERRKRKEATSLFQRAEEARVRAEAEAARLRAEAEAKAKESRQQIDFNSKADLNEAFGDFHSLVQDEVRAARDEFRGELVRTRVELSEQFMRQTKEDYDHTLDRAGIKEAVTIDPATGRPRDPFLHALIYGAANPAAVAYEYGKGKLAEITESEAEARGEQRGRQEVVERVVSNAGKPKGIAHLSHSSAARTGGYSFADIDRMGDEQKAHIKKTYPDLWRSYLENVPPARAG